MIGYLYRRYIIPNVRFLREIKKQVDILNEFNEDVDLVEPKIKPLNVHKVNNNKTEEEV